MSVERVERGESAVGSVRVEDGRLRVGGSRTKPSNVFPYNFNVHEMYSKIEKMHIPSKDTCKIIYSS